MIYDVHCHILPGVDDGARNEESTRRMLQIAASEGISTIVTTPHFTHGMGMDRREKVIDIYNEVRGWWKEICADGEMYLGNEVFYGESVLEDLRSGKALTMDDTRYVLLEFHTYTDYRTMSRALQSLLYAGYYPILAHVERYDSLQSVDRVQELVKMGVYIQVNTSAILGHHGLKIKLYVTKLLKESLVHFIGTDAHNSKERRPEMKKCREYLEKKIGIREASRLLEKNPARMIKGERLDGETRAH